jgi:hypothetical protein
MNATVSKSKSSRIGLRVRIVTGAATGAQGVITNVDAGSNTTWYRVTFSPPVYIADVGHVAGVWRTSDGIEDVK